MLREQSLSVFLCRMNFSLGNGIGADGARSLADALKVNHSLQKLNLKCMGFCVDCWSASVLREMSLSIYLYPMHCPFSQCVRC